MPRRAISPQQKADIKALIVKTLKSGVSIKDAYCYAGIDDNTYYRWLKDDREFRDGIDHSQAQIAVMCTHNIIKAGDKDWKASHAWLKSNRSDIWGDKTTISGDKENPINVNSKIEHHINTDTANTIFDILAGTGAFEAPANDTEDDEVHPTRPS